MPLEICNKCIEEKHNHVSSFELDLTFEVICAYKKYLILLKNNKYK